VLRAVRALELPEQYDKFLDEALVWRELAHNFTFYDPRHASVEGIPYWAAEELRRGEHDPRPVIYSAETLERAQTDEELWNAAQRAYLLDGWAHNAVRMLWGKTVLQWTPTVAECFRILVHLNNKYSLDGSDPNSYMNILWSLGKFDRPFYRRPIYGAVRYQSLKSARKRFDVRAYVQRYADTTNGAASAEQQPLAV
jgi:deoxyribodipyrimidine photo-lyase